MATLWISSVNSEPLAALTSTEAESIIENLRYGVPPHGSIRHFTVGRKNELEWLRQSLTHPTRNRGAALLVKANYGAGKSHLLQLVREMALESNYAVSLVEVNALEGVRFNRMDTIMGAISQRMEVPGDSGIGIGRLFDAFECRSDETDESIAISSDEYWGYSDYLKAPGVYVALRAWCQCEPFSSVGESHVANSADRFVRDLVEDWLANPAEYRTQRKMLYQELVADLRSRFRDPRAEWQFYGDEVFAFHTGGHRNAWAALADYDVIARASGLNGLVILFDEFEDIIQNLNRRDYQQEAFLNLFRFFAGERFPGMAYFAVTPDFVAKCKVELMSRGVFDFDFNRFSRLPFFEMSEIAETDFLELAKRIRAVHAVAFGWSAAEALPDVELSRLADKLWSIRTPERVRFATRGVVDKLTELFENA
jgi:P-loop Domain of unknown function (DUF2791)